MNGLELLKKHCIFERPQDVYVLFGITRRKDNKEITNSQEVVFREVLRKPEDIEKRYHRLIATIKAYIHKNGEKLNFYVYISVNPRDSIKAIFNLRNMLDKWVLETIRGADKTINFKRIDTEWLSCLMSPECKSGRGLFLIDLDTKSGEKFGSLYKKLEMLNIKIISSVETRNGYHIITEPFDKRIISEYEIKIDSLLFVDYIEAKC